MPHPDISASDHHSLDSPCCCSLLAGDPERRAVDIRSCKNGTWYPVDAPLALDAQVPSGTWNQAGGVKPAFDKKKRPGYQPSPHILGEGAQKVRSQPLTDGKRRLAA
jgi:hypothetical protein